MTEGTPPPRNDSRAVLERRFDGPIPPHLIETQASRERRNTGACNLIAAMAASYRREFWRKLAQTRIAFESAPAPIAAIYRERLEASARNLASLFVHTDAGKRVD